MNDSNLWLDAEARKFSFDEGEAVTQLITPKELCESFDIDFDALMKNSQFLLSSLVQEGEETTRSEAQLILLKLQRSRLVIEADMYKERLTHLRKLSDQISKMVDGKFAHHYTGIKEGTRSVTQEYDRCSKIFLVFFSTQLELRKSFERLTKARAAFSEIRNVREQLKGELQNLILETKYSGKSGVKVFDHKEKPHGFTTAGKKTDAKNLEQEIQALRKELAELKEAISIFGSNGPFEIDQLNDSQMRAIVKAKEISARHSLI
jgi:hypothetical protein